MKLKNNRISADSTIILNIHNVNQKIILLYDTKINRLTVFRIFHTNNCKKFFHKILRSNINKK